jgi:hypothetical protein
VFPRGVKISHMLDAVVRSLVEGGLPPSLPWLSEAALSIISEYTLSNNYEYLATNRGTRGLRACNLKLPLAHLLMK